MSLTKKNGRNKFSDNGSGKAIEAGPSGNCARENIIRLSSLNPYITCPLCNGYLVEATTVIDCLHTFCKSCLLKYFEENNDCPKCHYQIHQSHPSHYVAFDRTMQDIVYKLVPGMQAEEQRRREQFKKRQQMKGGREMNGRTAAAEHPQQHHQQPISSASAAAQQPLNKLDGTAKADVVEQPKSTDVAVVTPSPKIDTPEENGRNDETNCAPKMDCCCADQDPTMAHRREDKPVLIRLVPGTNLNPIDRSFIRLSAFATVNTVKRLLAFLLLNDITKYNDFDIFCNRELMGRDFSMAFIRKTRWRSKKEPLELTYKEHLEF